MGGRGRLGSPRTLASGVHGTRRNSDSPDGDGRAHRGLVPQNAGQSEERGRGRARTSTTSPARPAEGELGSPGDPGHTSTARTQRQFGPRPDGRKISLMAAAGRDEFLLVTGVLASLGSTLCWPQHPEKCPRQRFCRGSGGAADAGPVRTDGRAEVTRDRGPRRREGRSPSSREAPSERPVLEPRRERSPTDERPPLSSTAGACRTVSEHASQRSGGKARYRWRRDCDSSCLR